MDQNPSDWNPVYKSVVRGDTFPAWILVRDFFLNVWSLFIIPFFRIFSSLPFKILSILCWCQEACKKSTYIFCIQILWIFTTIINLKSITQKFQNKWTFHVYSKTGIIRHLGQQVRAKLIWRLKHILTVLKIKSKILL